MKTPHGYFKSSSLERKKMVCTERKKNMQTHIHPNAEIERQRKSEQEIELEIIIKKNE